jgi:single-strand DNA-binding protein
VSVFGRQAEVCNQYLEKGRTVLCSGEIRTSQYDDQQGVTRYSWELRADVVKFVGGPGERGTVPAMDGSMDRGEQSIAEEDIPF